MSSWVPVHGLLNAEKLTQDVLNRPTSELTERTQWLYDQLKSLMGASPFESVRTVSAPLTMTGDTAPVVGNFVCLDVTTKLYRRATAEMAIDDLFVASPNAYALGLLIEKSGSTGTVVFYGRLDFTAMPGSWTTALLLQTGEQFRSGSYYLSTEPGKMTAIPSGPAIYLGTFTNDTATPADMSMAALSPQVKDIGESHQHRNYVLTPQPAGQQLVSGTLPTDHHTVAGFSPVGALAPTDAVPRLVVDGTWTGDAATQYTVWLSNAAGTTQATSAAPTSFLDLVLHWLSNDVEEGQGMVRVSSFEQRVAIGTKGLYCALENMLEDTTAITAINWSVPYTAAIDGYLKRSWVVTAPDQIQGWLANRVRLTLPQTTGTDRNYTWRLMGGPIQNADLRTLDTLTIMCPANPYFLMTYTGQPADADTIQLGGNTFEFDNNGAITPGNIEVPIGLTADETYRNFLSAQRDANQVGCVVVLDPDTNKLAVSPTAAGVVISAANLSMTGPTTAAGVLTVAAGTATLLVYDDNGLNMVDYTEPRLADPEYWEARLLKNGLYLMAVPFSTAGAAASSDTVAAQDTYQDELVDEAPGAYFKYAIGAHASMNQHYPPIPRQTAALVLNGVEQDSAELFPADPTYAVGATTLYWYSNLYGTVPWPIDWSSPLAPGVDVKNALFYLVRMTLGDTGLVTSLRPATNAPIKITRCGTGDAATVGDLQIDVDLNLQNDNASLAGYQVVKAAQGQKLRRGPVVERIVAGAGISISSSGGAPNGQGIVTVSNSGTAYSGEFEEVALENAKQELLGMFPYIQLYGWVTGATTNIPTGFVAKFRVPHTIGDNQFRVIVYCTVFGEDTIPWIGGGSVRNAGLEFSYSVLPDYYNPVTGVPPYTFPNNPQWYNLRTNLINPVARKVSIPFGFYDAAHTGGADIYTAFDPMLIHNNKDEQHPTGAGYTGGDQDRMVVQALGDVFPNVAESPTYPSVTMGDLVAIRIRRAANQMGGTEYTGKLGFINLRWQLVAL